VEELALDGCRDALPLPTSEEVENNAFLFNGTPNWLCFDTASPAPDATLCPPAQDGTHAALLPAGSACCRELIGRGGVPDLQTAT